MTTKVRTPTAAAEPVESTQPDKDDFEVEVAAGVAAPAQTGAPADAADADASGAVDGGASEGDLEEYSERVRKRIDKLTYEAREERRRAEEAMQIAQSQKAEIERLRQQLQRGDEALFTQAQQRLKTELEQAQSRLRAAYEAGDADGIVTANTRIAEITAESVRLATLRSRPSAQQTAPQQTQTQPPQAPQASQPSPRALAWAAENPWFGKDPELTGYAFGVHQNLVYQGVAPDSEEYYNAITAAVRERFSDKVGSGESATRKRPSSVVAPGGRSTAAAPRKVVLTERQIAIARRLNVKPEDYAAEILKLNKEQPNG